MLAGNVRLSGIDTAMKETQLRSSTIWMVRLPEEIGFVMVAVMIGQSGLQLQSIRTGRLRLQEQQEHLN